MASRLCTDLTKQKQNTGKESIQFLGIYYFPYPLSDSILFTSHLSRFTFIGMIKTIAKDKQLDSLEDLEFSTYTIKFYSTELNGSTKTTKTGVDLSLVIFYW